MQIMNDSSNLSLPTDYRVPRNYFQIKKIRKTKINKNVHEDNFLQILLKKNISPGPAKYNPYPEAVIQEHKYSRKPKKTNYLDDLAKLHKTLPGVGAYCLQYQHKISPIKQQPQRLDFFDGLMFKSNLVPGPGHYNSKTLKKHVSVHLIKSTSFQADKKQKKPQPNMVLFDNAKTRKSLNGFKFPMDPRFHTRKVTNGTQSKSESKDHPLYVTWSDKKVYRKRIYDSISKPFLHGIYN